MPVILRVACALASSLTPVTYFCTLLGIRCVAAFMQLELFRAYVRNIKRFAQNKRTDNQESIFWAKY
ncbi:hypothetical protein B9Q28_07175 [Enterobacter cloacae]|nr:hypothetical protein B9Q28_07175 [Enterobacter cloacae]